MSLSKIKAEEDLLQEEGIVLQVPNFIGNLWFIVSNPSYQNIVSWSEDGCSFIIKNKDKLASDILPNHFKHNNFSSFLRQLNKYDFHKVKTLVNSSELEFSNDNFIRDCPQLLPNIKKKQSSQSYSEDVLKDLLNKVESLKQSQEDFETCIDSLSRAQESFSKETSELKNQQRVQQKIIQNVFTFLANMVKDDEDDGDGHVICLPGGRFINKNLMAITENSHQQTEGGSGESFSGNSQEKEIFDLLGDSNVSMLNPDTMSEESYPPAAMTQHRTLIDDSSCFVNPVHDSDDDIRSQLGKIQTTENNSYLQTSSTDSVLNISDLDFGELVRLDPSEAPIPRPTSSVINCNEPVSESRTDLIPLITTTPSPLEMNDFTNHLNSIQSDIDILKDLMSDADLNLNLSEVLELFNSDLTTSENQYSSNQP